MMEADDGGRSMDVEEGIREIVSSAVAVVVTVTVTAAVTTVSV